MSISSITFLFFFLPAVVVLCLALRLAGKGWASSHDEFKGYAPAHAEVQAKKPSYVITKLVLLFASAVFYAWTALEYLPHLAIITLFVYLLALAIQQQEGAARKALLILGVVANVGFLMFYKYLDFFGNTFAWRVGLEYESLNLIQPLGISFLVFSLISYLMDVYRKTIPADKNLLNVALWSFFFVKITSGPIVRYNQMYRDGEISPANPTIDDVASGARRFVMGLAKKIVLANTLGQTVDTIFSMQPDGITGPVAWLGIICYTFQIYLDFSGYSDMALGMARMLGFRFEENFDYPYVSKTIGEFWHRWHISLSSWLRDYLYFPLGGSRRGNVYVNLMIVFLVSGLWHGASFHFIAWGAWYGIFMIVDRVYRLYIQPKFKLPVALTWLFTMLVVIFGWVLFRADSMSQAMSYMLNMVGVGTDPLSEWGFLHFFDLRTASFLGVSVLLSTPLFKKLSQRFGHTALWQIVSMVAIPVLFAVSVLFVLNTDYSPFMYAQF